ncbi:hypothetical protein J6TS2_31620 [Heyndrickxia sporothermodurans]|nr:hypothetical protein J6TS2_31620 [Heyndrickxia sporothermodurans]
MKDVGGGLTAQHGIEATLPKPKGLTSDPVYKETIRREKRYSKIAQYEEKVQIIQDCMYLISNERESKVLYWLLEGKSYRWIGMYMGLSHSHIRRIRDKIIDQLFNAFVPNVPKE